MHARVDELLSLRDAEPVSAHVMQHVRDCAQCAARAEALLQTRARLRTLAQLEAPASAWEAIRDSYERERQTAARPSARRSVRSQWVAIAASIACIAALISLRGAQDQALEPQRAQATARPTGEPASSAAELTALVERSRLLEDYLRALPARPHVERVSMAATLDSIEQRIQWLDYQLLHANGGALSEQQAQQLWQERVQLMDSLVTVRYAEAGRTWL